MATTAGLGGEGLFAPLAHRLRGFTARRVRDDDRPFLEELYLTCHEHEVMGIPPSQRGGLLVQQSHLQVEQYAVAFPRAEHWILERRGQPVGRFIFQDGPEQAYLVDLGFLPEARSQGWGKALVGRVQFQAGRLARPLGCHVFVENHDAQRFWRRMGFREVRTDALHLYFDWTPVSRPAG